MNKPLLFAKIYGTLLFVFFIASMLSLYYLLGFSAAKNIELSQLSVFNDATAALPIVVLSNILAGIAGFGLIKSKLYGIYALIFLSFLQIITWIQHPTTNFLLLISVAITAYFYMQRKVFKK
jgi:hypothetical protein